jgi:hypothetical protein
MNDTLKTLLIFLVLITAPIWIIAVGGLIYLAVAFLYLVPVIYGFNIYFIYGAVSLFIVVFYVLGKRRKREVREIDFYTPSFVVKKERR